MAWGASAGCHGPSHSGLVHAHPAHVSPTAAAPPGATVDVAQRHTGDLAAARAAGIPAVAAGVPGLIGPEHVGPGATVIHVGVHRTPYGPTGDVHRVHSTGSPHGPPRCPAASPR
ncbi:hypothetical protein [Streptomyces europaeiscabiei]|uniref:hypothetical protein n=1 Tax=Streptomyces europaeiscabiei TaxID=146819 RepID=UPI002E17AE08